jgi:hypothetical protein
VFATVRKPSLSKTARQRSEASCCPGGPLQRGRSETEASAQHAGISHPKPPHGTSGPRWSPATFVKPTSGRNPVSMVWGSQSIAATMRAPPFLVDITRQLLPGYCRQEHQRVGKVTRLSPESRCFVRSYFRPRRMDGSYFATQKQIIRFGEPAQSLFDSPPYDRQFRTAAGRRGLHIF